MADPNEQQSKIRADFTRTAAAAQELLDQIERNIAEAKAVGDEVQVARLEARKQAVQSYGPAREVPQIQESTAALQRQNQVAQQGLDIELRRLEVLKMEADLRRQAQSIVIPSTGYRAGSYESLAGPTAVAEAEARAAAARAEAAPVGYRTGVAHEDLAASQQAADAARAKAAAERAAADAAAADVEAQRQQTLQLERQNALRAQWMANARTAGFAVGSGQAAWSGGQRMSLIAGPEGAAAQAMGGAFSAADRQAARLAVSLGEYEGYAGRASLQTNVLTADLTRLGMVEAEQANAMREHGALTTEWLSALARGETTVSEFGYQMGATIGKFAGWTAAASATYGALGAVFEFGKGAVDSANAVGQLKRTIDGLDTQKAAQALRGLSAGTAVSIKEAGDAVFQFSRTFHNLPDATQAARLGLAAFQLDNVKLADSVRMSTSLSVQWGLSMGGLASVYDMLSAGQREYNARLSDMIPLVQTASGAVHSAGGNLDQLIQLGTVATRLTQLGGTRVGTAFYRSASNFTRQNAAALAHGFGLGGDINPLTGQGNWTQLLIDAIHKSVNLPGGERNQLAVDIFGKQFGGRMAALFSSQGAALLDQITGRTPAGPGRSPITPEATHGKLNQELAIQLAQTRKELDQFVFGLQRFGSALASSGALAPLGLALQGVVGGLNLLAKPIEMFSQLPSAAKEAAAGLVELRLAMLFFSRTRLGSSAPGITSIPGFRPSEATVARRDLAIGTRTAMNAVEADLQKTTSAQLANSARMLEYKRAQEQIEAQIADSGGANAGLLEQSNSVNARIAELQATNTRLAAERLAQERALAGLQEQQVGLTATSRRLRWSDPQVLALRNQTQVGTEAATAAEGEMGLGGLAMSRAAAAKARLAALFRRDAIALDEVAAAEGELAAASAADAAAAGAATVETEAQVTVLQATRTSIAGMAARVGGLAAALDPLTVGLVALPFVMSAFSSASQKASSAAEAARQALAEPAGDLSNLNTQVQKLTQAAERQREAVPGRDPRHPLTNTPGLYAVQWTWDDLQRGWQNLTGSGPGNAAQTQQLAQSAGALAQHYESYIKSLQQEGPALLRTAQGRTHLVRVMDEMTQMAKVGAQAVFVGHPEAMANAIKDFESALQQQYQSLVNAAAQSKRGLHGSEAQIFGTIAAVPAKTMGSYLQSLDDYSKVFGTQNSSLRTAAQYYAALTDKYRSSTGDDASMQALSSAQQNFINAVNKNVQDLMHASTLSTTSTGATGDLHQAITLLNNERSQVVTAFSQAIAYAKETGQSTQSIRLLNEAERQLLSQLADLHQQVVQQILAVVKSEADVATAAIRGISPEADIQRAQSTVSGIQRQLAAARANGADAQTINGLMAQLYNQQNSVYKNQVDNARNIVQAQGQLAQASITGISPQDDIARAQAAVSSAQQLLSFDQSHGAGEAQIIQDQAALDSSIYSLNQSIQQHAQQVEADAKAMIEAQASLAESQTTDPVMQARIALRAAQQELTVIRPQDYKTYQEYQTAILNQKATVGKDIQSLRQAIVDQDERTLKFELDTLRITDQQYIHGLEQLLKMKHLSLQTRQQLMQEIFDTSTKTAVSLNTGNMTMPTTYQVKAAIRSAMLGRHAAMSAGAAIVQQNTTTTQVNVYVTKNADIGKVARALDHALGTSVQAAAQAAGML